MQNQNVFAKSSGHDAARWQAVLARDVRNDGRFFYAVQSTGIYCRPVCSSRRPDPRQVVFFDAAIQAEQAGFRPCKRCKPSQTDGRPSDHQRVRQICRRLEQGLEESPDARPTLEYLAAPAGLNVHQLERLFRRTLGITPRKYVESLRLHKFKKRLKKGENVTTALYETGYGSSSRIYEKAPAHLGMTPDTYRRGGAGMQIVFTIVDSPLGRLLVGATQRGVSAVYLGEEDDRLRKALRLEYPRADLREERGALRNWVAALLDHLRGTVPDLELPLDIQATAFQRRVWEELRRIPFGTTRTYTQIARAIHRPAAVRAVARACATNPVSIVVPCHRVIRRDGSLAGYRWGLQRKKTLLENERIRAAASARPASPKPRKAVR
jgi:AraC family transcriptional regulator, regulatory protein of adaptative response / methylated-DNA-[protein]-cysteine methyltransferase